MNSAMVLIKIVSTISETFFFYRLPYFLSKLVETVFVGTAFVSTIISSHVTTEFLTILAKYLPFSQLHVAGFPI